MADFKGWEETSEGTYEADLGDAINVAVGQSGDKWRILVFDRQRFHPGPAFDAKLAAFRMLEEELESPMKRFGLSRMTQEQLDVLRAKVRKLDPRVSATD